MASYAQFIYEKNLVGCLLKGALGHPNNTYSKVDAGDIIYIVSNVLGKRVIVGELKVVKKFTAEKKDFIWSELGEEKKPFKYRVYGLINKYEIPVEVSDEMITATPQNRPLSDSVILRGGNTIPLTNKTANLISSLAIQDKLNRLKEIEELKEED